MRAMHSLDHSRRAALGDLLDALHRRSELHAHLNRVARLARRVGLRMGLGGRPLGDLVRSAELHDVGKLLIPERILDKPGPLGEREWELIRMHTMYGERLLTLIPALAALAPAVRASHERWDGAGYPDGLGEEEIPLLARVISVCDAFDAMTSERSYRRPVTRESAIAELARCAGSQFDPVAAAALGRELGLASS
jgi:two-component system cell cycle response regulator